MDVNLGTTPNKECDVSEICVTSLCDAGIHYDLFLKKLRTHEKEVCLKDFDDMLFKLMNLKSETSTAVKKQISEMLRK